MHFKNALEISANKFEQFTEPFLLKNDGAQVLVQLVDVSQYVYYEVYKCSHKTVYPI